MGRKASLLSLVAAVAALTGVSLLMMEVEPLLAAGQIALLALMAVALQRWPPVAPEGVLVQVARLRREAREKESELATLIDKHAAVIHEIHHRVKNNLQIVYSILDLQVSRLSSPEARKALAATRARISALALLHRHLYDDLDLLSVEMRPFIEELCAHLDTLEDGHNSGHVVITVNVDAGRLASDQAAGVGQIITEAALNARQHAFPGDRIGVIQVSLRMASPDATLTIADNGLGLALTPTGDLPATGVGSALIHSFAQQIGGSAVITNGPGATVTVRFRPQFASNRETS